MKPHNLEETAMTDTSRGTNSDQKEQSAPLSLTETSNPTDMTVVRDGPSEATVSDLPSASNPPDSTNPATPANPQSFGKYDLVGEIARGGMGIVYRARQHGLDRLVALKMILGKGVDQESAQRFLLEARAAAALDHPNVVPIYDIGEIGDRPYFTMALIEGPNLRAFVETRGVPSIATTVSLFAQIVAGVAHAHKHGIIHRDLKPANVLIDKDGRPRVTDFGLAKRTSVDTNLTATGQVVGTPQYMAPEQARDSKDVGPPADVYALGAILYFMLTGRPPFQGESFTDLLIKVVSEPPDPPRLSQPDIPDDLEALCLKCLAKTPPERFADAAELGEALSSIAERFMGPSAIFTPSRGSLPKIGSAPSVGGVPGLSTTSSGPAFANSMSGTVPAEAPPNRKPVLVGLGAMAVLMIAAIVYLATRDKTSGEVVKQDPPPVVNPGPVNPGPNPPDTKVGQRFEWPTVSPTDFALKVKMNPEPKDGVLPVDKDIYIELTADRDCFVLVWVTDAEGDTLLFPNADEPDGMLKAGQPRVVPGKNAGTITSTPTVGDVDRLRVIATTGPRPVIPIGKSAGKFTRYESENERQEVATVMRGLVYKKADTSNAAISAREELFRVQK